MKDYSDVNYSSLREGTLDENAYWNEVQTFLIDNFKELELRLFLESLVINSDTIKASQVNEILRYHTWIVPKRHYFDASKEILATERELKLGLKTPLMIMEAEGYDPEEILKSWALYERLCKQYGLTFNVKGDSEEKIATEDQDYDDKTVQDDAINHNRD